MTKINMDIFVIIYFWVMFASATKNVMFSKACEYGIKASIFIAEQSLKGDKVGQVAITKAINSPEAFTAKTLQILKNKELLVLKEVHTVDISSMKFS